jgi:hypothetical protein
MREPIKNVDRSTFRGCWRRENLPSYFSGHVGQSKVLIDLEKERIIDPHIFRVPSKTSFKWLFFGALLEMLYPDQACDRNYPCELMIQVEVVIIPSLVKPCSITPNQIWIGFQSMPTKNVYIFFSHSIKPGLDSTLKGWIFLVTQVMNWNHNSVRRKKKFKWKYWVMLLFIHG